jgi:hypothetical protein
MTRRRTGRTLSLLAAAALAPAVPAASPRAQEPRGDPAIAMQPRIDRAIDRGVEFLLQAQLRDGSWHDHEDAFETGQTALALHALLVSGVPATHPAVVRGFAHIEGRTPDTVYALACQLLAYGSLGDARHEPRMEELVDLLVDWQEGSFGYPDNPRIRNPNNRMRGRPDLSNTQFAALGLRAAGAAGLRVPAKTWKDLLDATLDYQEPASTVEAPARADGRSSSGTFEVAGFAYHSPNTEPAALGRGALRRGPPEWSPTGSMTTAGITVLEVCRRGLGRKLSSKDGATVERAIQRGLNWLALHYSVERNPGADGNGWQNYYLYGLERVGDLLGLRTIGGNDWYVDGARRLIDFQRASGSWSGGSEDATSFALLFLERATLPTTGRSEDRVRLRDVRDVGGAVGLRATGTSPLVLWITGLDEDALVEAGLDPRATRVVEVHYVVDGLPVATIEGDRTRPWNGERYPVRHVFDAPGVHHVRARVHVAGSADGPGGEVLLESHELELEVRDVEAPWMVALARAENLLQGAEYELRASSSRPTAPAPWAVDGLQGTAWLASPGDLTPTITLRFERSVRVDRITLSPADARPRDVLRHDQLVSARVALDDDPPIVVTFGADPLEPGVIELERPRALRRLEITLGERVPGSGRKGGVGLAEIGIEYVR